MIKAYKIQGGFQIKNAFNKVELDNQILVQVVSSTVISLMPGLTFKQELNGLSCTLIDRLS